MRNRTLLIIQARMSSTRLPGKVMSEILGHPMLELLIDRIRPAKLVDKIIVATSSRADDDIIEDLCRENNIDCFRGCLNNVLNRYYLAARTVGPFENIVRITGDCPFVDPDIIDACVALHIANGSDYTSNKIPATYPKGLDVEVITFKTLEKSATEATDPYQLEHVTPYIYQNPSVFSLSPLCYTSDLSTLRWTVDYPEDMEFARTVFDNLSKGGRLFGWLDMLRFLRSNPHITRINMNLS